MNTNTLLVQVLQYVIELGIGVLVPVLVKFVMSKIGTEQLLQAKSYAAVAVAAVEQTMSSADGQAKKTAAVKKLSDLTKGALKPEDIDHLIEDAVFTLSKQIGHTVQQYQDVPTVKSKIGFTNKSADQTASASPMATEAVPSKQPA